MKELSGLQKEACLAYGIAAEHVFAASEREGVATIVTNGGTKVRFGKGQKTEGIKRLTPAQLGADSRAKIEAAAKRTQKKEKE
jgi:hypothetical protein